MRSPILSASEASSCSSRFDPFGDKRRKHLTKSWLQSLSAGGPPGLFDHIYPLAYYDRTIESGGTATHLVRRPHTPLDGIAFGRFPSGSTGGSRCLGFSEAAAVRAAAGSASVSCSAVHSVRMDSRTCGVMYSAPSRSTIARRPRRSLSLATIAQNAS